MSLNHKRSKRAAFCRLMLLLLLSFSPAFAQNTLTPQETRGKQIYVKGISSSGKEIIANVGALGISGSSLPCANCHGSDGRGKPEAGVDPLRVTWSALTDPKGLTRPDGNSRGPYTEENLGVAITLGVDPDKHEFSYLMPRYKLSEEDLTDLIAYLKLLPVPSDPGISDDKIVVGSLLPPPSGPLGELGQAVKAVTTAYFTELNNAGGIFNRRIELRFSETGDTPAATRANLEHLLAGDVFAMSGAFIAGAEKETTSVLAQQQVPLVGPLTLDPQAGPPLNRQVFYLLSGASEQGRALVNFMATKAELKRQTLLVVHVPGPLSTKLLDAVQDQAKKLSLQPLQIQEFASSGFDAAAVVSQLKNKKPAALFFLGSSEQLASLLKEFGKASWFPTVFAPVTSMGNAIFDAHTGFDGRIFFSLTTVPNDQKDGIAAFRELSLKYKLPSKHLASQVSAYSAAKIFTEALRLAGRDLSREKFIEALESFHDHQTGLTPPITFGPSRRIGALGAYVVTIDLKEKKFVPASGWVGVE